MGEIAGISVVMGEHANDVEDNPEDGHVDFLIGFSGGNPFRKDDTNSANKRCLDKYGHFDEIKCS